MLVHRHAYRFALHTGAGVIEIGAWHGQDPVDRHWGCPLRERWELAAGQRLSPGWEQNLAFALTVTTSYAGAEALLTDKVVVSWQAGGGQRGATIRREQNYFAEHARRMNYRVIAQRG